MCGRKNTEQLLRKYAEKTNHRLSTHHHHPLQCLNSDCVQTTMLAYGISYASIRCRLKYILDTIV